MIEQQSETILDFVDMEVDKIVKMLFSGNLQSGVKGDDGGEDSKQMNKAMPESIKPFIENKMKW